MINLMIRWSSRITQRIRLDNRALSRSSVAILASCGPMLRILYMMNGTQVVPAAMISILKKVVKKVTRVSKMTRSLI